MLLLLLFNEFPCSLTHDKSHLKACHSEGAFLCLGSIERELEESRNLEPDHFIAGRAGGGRGKGRGRRVEGRGGRGHLVHSLLIFFPRNVYSKDATTIH